MNSGQEIEAVVDQVSQLLQRQIGLRLDPGLRGRLRRCIRDDSLRPGHYVDTYIDTLVVGSEALQSLLNNVTVQETAFFRHPEHFELLAREVLPSLAPPVTIWSAGCANGQEAFSLAMLLEEQGIDGDIVATDLSSHALRRTTAARYSTRELNGLSLDRIGRHLTRDGDTWLVNRNIRDRVGIFQHNLLHPVPHQVSACEVIFCRNVLIYFSPSHAKRFLDQVADVLPAASLFLGAAETIWQLSDRFETVRSGDTFRYQTQRAVAKTRDRSSPELALSQNYLPRIRHTDEMANPPGPRHTVTPPPSAPAQAPPTPSTLSSLSRSPQELSPTGDGADEVLLAQAGQQASAVGDVQAAVVAFRKCAYLAPNDPMAHLHLALALESAGDHASAQRAFAAARHTLTDSDPAHVDRVIEGYTMADLLRLIDSKQQGVTP
jgi:chemotaxis protein methyltransferase CheR